MSGQLAPSVQSVEHGPFAQINLGDLNTGNIGDFAVTAQLVSVTSETTTPDMGTVVASFTQNGVIPTTGFSNVEFDPTSTFRFSASNFYWFVLSGSSSDQSGSVQWQFADTFNSAGPGSLPNIANIFIGSGGWTFLNEPPFLIQVDATTAVPEPGSLALGCMGMVAVVFARRQVMKSARGAT
jgi:PEP-CTERM motif